MAIPVAFYAPLKSPDDPTPSGDRSFARLLMVALERAGFAPELASRLRLFHRGDDALPILEQAAAAEIKRLTNLFAARPEAARPRIWFTYHVYYKTPDLIGPSLARIFGIPYVIAEGSRGPKRAHGAAARGHALAEAALDRADLILVPNPADLPMLEAAKPPGQGLARLPPFIDTVRWPEIARATNRDGPPRLLTVAMMRPGDKLASYRLLAQALAYPGLPAWTLDVVGDGPARMDVARLFAPFDARVRFHGLIADPAALAPLYARADLLVWPAVNEAFGMVFLEAARYGCPAVAGAYGGVGAVVRNGESGILAAPGNTDSFAEAVVAGLAERRRLGAGARRLVMDEGTLERASDRLRGSLVPLLATSQDPVP